MHQTRTSFSKRTKGDRCDLMDEKVVNHFKNDAPINVINEEKKSSTISTLHVSSKGTILHKKPDGEDYIACASQKTSAPLDLRDWVTALILLYFVAIVI
jgi:hypothetical protein